MATSPSKLSQFWKELKRRNVIRVITVYTGAAFVILSLVDMIREPFELPNWSFKLVVVILSLGLIIAVILSWIYDIHPEAGMVKTEPADKIKPEELSRSSNSWKIASYISFVVIVGLIILNVIPHSGKKEILDKSIAVLPFINDSQDQENEHLINGIMDELLIDLQSIKELRVPGRTSTEQYRNNPKPIPEIATEMNVAYIVEGSGQWYGNKIRLRVQLVEGASDKHIWADTYDEVINGTEDIFRIQSEIAQSIATELQAVITPEEKQLIDNIPTTSLTAYDFYQKAVEEHSKHWLKWNDMEAVDRAEDLYHLALEYDSTFAQAYIGLASVYWHKHYGDVLSENYLDSMLILLNIALSFDDQLAQAYQKRGDYYKVNNNKEQAIKEYKKALKLNPNDWVVYLNSTIGLYDDEAIIIEYLLKAASLNEGWYLPRLYRGIAIHLGPFSKEKSEYYLEEALKLDIDSADHFRALASIENNSDNLEKAIAFGEKSYAFDFTDNWVIYLLAVNHGFLGQFEESLEYFKEYEEINNLKKVDPRNVDIRDKFRIGYAYWINGFKEEGEYYIDEGLKIYNQLLDLNRISPQDFNTLYGFAAVYTFQGDREKSYEYLRLLSQKQMVPQRMVKDLNYDPMFDSIRDELEFQQIVRDLEAKYEADHERVRQWLEENHIL